MSETETRQPMVAAGTEQPVRAELVATAQYLSFDPGLYAVDFSVAQSGATDIGLRLPCLRLEPIPPTARQKGRAFVSSLAEGGWLWRGEEPTFVLVVGSQAGVVLTVYKASDGMASPQIRIRYMGGQGLAPGGAASHQVTATAAAVAPAAPALPAPAGPAAPAAAPLSKLVHVRGIGDVKSTGTDWTGQPGSGAPIEGFAIMPIGMIGRDDIEYQAVLGHNWNTPWFSGGEFCGSRGLALELLGFRVRLTGEAAGRFDCAAWGSFVGRGEVGPILDGEVCEAAGAPLEAIRVMVTPKAAAPKPEPEPEPEPEPPPKPKPRRSRK